MPRTLPEITTEELRSLKGSAIPRAVNVREFVDSTGDDALEATLVFADAVSDDDLRWSKVKGVVEAVRKLILEKDDADRYVYVRVRRKKELKNEP